MHEVERQMNKLAYFLFVGVLAARATAFAQTAPTPDAQTAPAPEVPDEPARRITAPPTSEVKGVAAQEQVVATAPPPSPSPSTGVASREQPKIRRHNDAAQVSRDGTFLPFTLSARIGDQYIAGRVLGGYDSTEGEGGL